MKDRPLGGTAHAQKIILYYVEPPMLEKLFCIIKKFPSKRWFFGSSDFSGNLCSHYAVLALELEGI